MPPAIRVCGELRKHVEKKIEVDGSCILENAVQLLLLRKRSFGEIQELEVLAEHWDLSFNNEIITT